jgi:glycosyltransferase involved in cell wall biosynthesis
VFDSENEMESRLVKDALIVLGMHRSGTSALAGALTLLGAAAPTRLMEANEFNARGYFESMAVMETNEAILGSGGSSWADWRQFNPKWFTTAVANQFRAQAVSAILDEFQGAPLIVLKDPRICRLAPLWLGALSDADYRSHALIIARNPLEVAASLNRRDGFSVGRGLLIWLRHTLDAEFSSRSIPRSIMTWPQLLGDWRSVLEKASVDLKLDWPRKSDLSDEEIDRFFAADLRHHKIADERLENRRDIDEWSRKAYKALQLLSVEPGSTEALDDLDKIRNEFNRTSKIYGPAFSGLEIEVRNVVLITAEAKLAASQRDVAQAQSNDLENRSASLLGQINENNAAHHVLQEALQSTIADLTQAIKGVQEELAQARAEAAARVEALAGEVASAQAQTNAEHDRATHVEQELAEANARFAAREQEMASEVASAQAQATSEHDRATRIEQELAEANAGFVAREQALAGEVASAQAQANAEHARTARIEQQLAEANAGFAAREQALAGEVASAQALATAEHDRATRIEQQLAEANAREELFASELSSAQTAFGAERERDASKSRLLAEEIVESGRQAEVMSAGATAQAGEIEALLRNFSAEVARAQEEAASQSKLVSALQAELATLHSSSWWRITEPLRRLRPDGRALTKRKPSLVQLTNASAAPASADASTERDSSETLTSPSVVSKVKRAESSLSDGTVSMGQHEVQATGTNSIERIGAAALSTATLVAIESDVEVITSSGLFDEAFYLGQNDVQLSGISPIEHYVRIGEASGLSPALLFDPEFYGQRNPDVSATGCNLFAHYISFGRNEGRSPRAVVLDLVFPTSRLSPDRETVVVAIHEATRTGASILAWNIIGELEKRYNVVALLKMGGPIEQAINDLASASVTLPANVAVSDFDTDEIAKQFIQHYAPKYVIANSVETRYFVPAFERAGVPAIALVHEFSSSVRPIGVLNDLFETASEIVFSADLVAEAALDDYRILVARPYSVLAQGQSSLPPDNAPAQGEDDERHIQDDLSRLPEDDGSILVIGVGTITPRKGVEFFIAAAANVARRNTTRKITFAWIGKCWFEPPYLDSLMEQVKRSGIEESFLFLGEFEDLAPVYARADLCFLSSRLDPLPNIAIDAAVHGIPVVCFDHASGMAEILSRSEETKSLVVPYLDAEAAANRIVELAEHPSNRATVASAMQAIAAQHFDMARYVEAIDALGQRAVRAKAQIQQDCDLIERHEAFNADLYLGARTSTPVEAREALVNYLGVSQRAAPRNRPRTGLLVRRPLEGFHPLVYAGENPDYNEAGGEDPLAHYARTGFPKGRWRNEVIRPTSPTTSGAHGLRVAVHGHFHYPDLLPELVERLRRNRTVVDLLLTTTSDDRAAALSEILSRLGVARASVTVVPNRGRDLGPMLTEIGQGGLARYNVVAHVHGKRSPHVHDSIGARWRTFIWENLIGGEHAMMDVVLAAFAAEDKLGLVFPTDPHLNDWDENRGIAEDLAERMGLDVPLPQHFDFPQGTMFWARPEALAPVLKLGLGWDDYPTEPLPIDGSMLHALERLLPFSAARAGYKCAVTHVDTVLR